MQLHIAGDNLVGGSTLSIVPADQLYSSTQLPQERSFSVVFYNVLIHPAHFKSSHSYNVLFHILQRLREIALPITEISFLVHNESWQFKKLEACGFSENKYLSTILFSGPIYSLSSCVVLSYHLASNGYSVDAFLSFLRDKISCPLAGNI